MSEVTWKDLSEPQQWLLRRLPVAQCYGVDRVIARALAGKGLVTVGPEQRARNKRNNWVSASITDRGRAILAQRKEDDRG